MTRKTCGTCQHIDWSFEVGGGYRECTALRDVRLPRWAVIGTGDHEDCVAPDDARRCDAWTPASSESTP